MSQKRRIRRIGPRGRAPVPAALYGIVLGLVALGAAGCGGAGTTKQTIEQAKTRAAAAEDVAPQDAKVVKVAPGKFDLSLGPASKSGAKERKVLGDATCSVRPTTGELRVAMRPVPEGKELFGLSVPGFHGTDTYSGELGVTGAERSEGPVDVGIDQSAGEDGVFRAGLSISFEGKVTGSAGDRSVQGAASCRLPDGTETAQGS